MKKPVTETHSDNPDLQSGFSREENSQSEFAPGTEEMEKLRDDLRKFQDLALRSAADLENYRKRMIREKEDSLRYANASLIERLLPVLDSFELGLEAARGTPEAEAITRGFEMVEKQLQDFLKDQGVEKIDALGHPFDPNSHEAVSQQNDPKVPEGDILHQIRKGYRLRERLLRPATVVLSKGPSEE